MSGAHFWDDLNSRSRLVLEKVLSGDSGIEKRHFAVESLEQCWTRDAEQLSLAYERESAPLAAKAVRQAVEHAGLKLEQVDALVVCSCTGYLCPGVSSHLAEELGLGEELIMQDITGFGCGAAVPLWRAASGVCALDEDAVVVSVQVEVCSAAFFVEDDFGVLISTCLFGDGAAAQVWRGTGPGLGWKMGDFESLHLPQHRELIRFTNRGGFLRNQLDRAVPGVAADAVQNLYERRRGDAQVMVTHGGGRDVMDAVEQKLNVDVGYARGVMRDFGNMSSPSVGIALERFVRDQAGAEVERADRAWVCAFGAGFSAHSAELVRG